MSSKQKKPLQVICSHDLFLLLQTDDQYDNDVTEEIISRIKSGQARFQSDLFGHFPTPETEVGIAAVAISRRATYSGGRFVRPIGHISDCFRTFAEKHSCWYDESYLKSNSTVQFRSGTESVVYVRNNDVFKLTSARDSYVHMAITEYVSDELVLEEV